MSIKNKLIWKNENRSKSVDITAQGKEELWEILRWEKSLENTAAQKFCVWYNTKNGIVQKLLRRKIYG